MSIAGYLDVAGGTITSNVPLVGHEGGVVDGLDRSHRGASDRPGRNHNQFGNVGNGEHHGLFPAIAAIVRQR